VSVAIQAQQVHFIPKLGVNIASMTNAEGTDSRIGLNAGVSGEIALTPLFALEPGVFDSMRNHCSESDVDVTMENDYINVNVTKALMRLMSRRTDKSVELFCNPMEVLNLVILRRALRFAIDSVAGLKGLTFDHIEDIVNLIKKGRSGDRIYLPKGIRAIKGYSTLTITAEPPGKLSTYKITEPHDIYLKESSIVF